MATNIPVVFKFGTRAEYDALQNKNEGALYFLTDTGELLRGTKNLAQANYYEVTVTDGESHTAAIERVTTSDGAILIKNDVCIVKEKLFDGAYSHTAYIYDGEVWRAMDGNYNAENVYFDQDLVFTKDVGYVTVGDSGSTTVATEGKNVKQVLEMLFAQETQPNVTSPTLVIEPSRVQSYEVGSEVTPSYNLTFNKGKYQYGPDTGITATYSVTDSNNNTPLTTSSGVFPKITIQDDTRYTMTATATYTQGAVPVTNLGNSAPEKRIAAGEISKTSAVFTGYRQFYYGAVAADVLTSGIIKQLTPSGGAPKAGTLPTYAANKVTNAKKIVVAIPKASPINVTKVLLKSAMNADITTEFVQQADFMQIPGKNDYAPVDYKIWIYQPAVLDPSEVYEITLG